MCFRKCFVRSYRLRHVYGQRSHLNGLSDDSLSVSVSVETCVGSSVTADVDGKDVGVVVVDDVNNAVDGEDFVVDDDEVNVVNVDSVDADVDGKAASDVMGTDTKVFIVFSGQEEVKEVVSDGEEVENVRKLALYVGGDEDAVEREVVVKVDSTVVEDVGISVLDIDERGVNSELD